MAGQIKNDRAQGIEARRVTLAKYLKLAKKDEENLLTDEEKSIFNQAWLRMCGNALPRLTELTGEDGGDIQVKIVNYGNPNTIPVRAPAVSVELSKSDG